ncbi:hypothetical protein FRACYDRAFT_268866, partial [Fragilariopsis cylindrus CCMP1102]
MMNANSEEDHRQPAAARAAKVARAARVVSRAAVIAAAIAAADDVVVAADVDAAARVARFGRVDAVDAADDAADAADAVAAVADAAADAAVVPATSFFDLPVNIRVSIINYLGETELKNLTLISKQVYKDCKQPGIECKIHSTIEIKPRQVQGGSILTIMQQLRNHHNHHNIMANEYIRRFDHMKVIDAYKFDLTSNSYQELYEELDDITNNFKMNSIPSLDMSMSFSMACDEDLYESPMPIVLALSQILPNLREIDLSNIST